MPLQWLDNFEGHINHVLFVIPRVCADPKILALSDAADTANNA